MSYARQGHPQQWVTVKSSNKMWSIGKGNGNPLQYSCLENLMGRCSVAVMSNTLQPHGLQYSRLLCPPLSPRVFSSFCSPWVQSQKQQVNLISFQGKPFSITVIQVYAPTTDAEVAEVDQFFEDLQDLLELTPKKMFFHHRGLQKQEVK